MYNPKISIVIPAYNASNYLAEAIESALAQTYSNTEIIVINDGSVDDGATRAVALSYGERIRYFEKENGGSSSALNTGVANMSGEWFSWLSHDDLYFPEKLEMQVALMKTLRVDTEDLSKHIFFSASELIDASGNVIRACNAKNEAKLATSVESFPDNRYLIAEPTVFSFHGCSCLVHKNAFRDVGGFDEKLRLLNDLDFWFRLYAAGYKVHYISAPLVKGRVHAKQVSKSISYSYHNTEQDMFWNRSLDWLITNDPENTDLLFRYGRNAYLKTRNVEGDRAFANIKGANAKKSVLKAIYKCLAWARNMAKIIYIKLKL